MPRIETKTGRFRLLAAIVVLGGLGRLVGLALTGIPSLFMLGGLFVELVVTPILTLADAGREPLRGRVWRRRPE